MSTDQHNIEAGPVEMSASIGKLAPALVKAQRNIEHASKDSENPHFGSKYADLAATFDACLDALLAQGIALTQPVAADGRKVRVCTMFLHESGEWMRATLTLTAQQDTPQAIGSAITYGRRYGLQSLAGVAAEDDDGNAASAAPPARQAQGRDSAKGQRSAPPSDPLAPAHDWLKRIAAAGSEGVLDAVKADLIMAADRGKAPHRSTPAGEAIAAALDQRRSALAKG